MHLEVLRIGQVVQVRDHSFRHCKRLYMAEKPTYKELEQKIKELEKEFEERSFSEKRLRTLFDISDAVNTTLNLDELYVSIYESLNNLLKLPNFYISIYDRNMQMIKFPFFIDQYDKLSYYEHKFHKSTSLTGEVILKKKSIFLTEQMLLKRANEKKIIGTMPLVYIGVPLMVQKEVIGVIAVQSYTDANYFSRKDEDILISVSNQIATAIDRKQTLDQIDILQNYLFNIINSMPSILVGVNKDKIITQWNFHAEVEIGVKAKDAIGEIVTEVFPRLAKNSDQICQSIKFGKIQTKLKQGYFKNEETRYEDIIIYPLITNGVEGAVIRIDDVTERVRLEEMMVQSEKMLSVGGLAAGMAHEINNPLAGMMQTASVMANRMGDNINMPANLKAAAAAGTTMEAIHSFMEARDIPQMIATINESGRRVAEIVDNMLSFARKSDGLVSSHNLDALIDRILELAATDYDLKKQYDFKAIKIQKEYEDNLPMVPCEGAKIQQVLLNILINGAQAMQENIGKKNQKQSRFILRLSHDVKINMLCMEIEDNGPGMSEDIRKRVFEPFFTTKGVGIGTGLGLSVSYFIITENHGGKMSVESTLGTGAKFIIHLPLEGRKE
jgi:PAS domain S-box-containing protein